MSEWKNVTDYFSEEQRYYNGKHLEIDEVYDVIMPGGIFFNFDLSTFF